MITLTGIFVYPVKSARGIALREATLGDRGLEHDRRFLIVDDDGRFVTQREEPRLALLYTGTTDDELSLSFEGKRIALPLRPSSGEPRKVRIFGDDVDGALDLGAVARSFLSEAFGRPLSLVYMPDGVRRQVDPSRAGPTDIVGFADAFPYLLASESSLRALNAVLSDPVPMKRFRPNFVIEGADAWAEDHYRELKIGALPFLALKPCSRCVIIDTDQDLGVRSPGPLAALARTHTLGKRAIFGQNLVARGTGTLRVGDPVLVSPPE
jgi:uncharacterized protein YcbX